MNEILVSLVSNKINICEDPTLEKEIISKTKLFVVKGGKSLILSLSNKIKLSSIRRRAALEGKPRPLGSPSTLTTPKEAGE